MAPKTAPEKALALGRTAAAVLGKLAALQPWCWVRKRPRLWRVQGQLRRRSKLPPVEAPASALKELNQERENNGNIAEAKNPPKKKLEGDQNQVFEKKELVQQVWIPRKHE
jgi:hypothetical protein